MLRCNWIFVCLAILVLVSQAMAGSLQTVPAGGTVFIGEQGLDISAGIPAGTLVSWHSASQQPGKVQAAVNYTVVNPKNFNVNAETFEDNQSNWYMGKWYIGNTTTVAFIVADPTLDLKIWDQQNQVDISGQTIQPGDYINFRIDTNLNVIPKERNTNDAFLAISVRNPGGELLFTTETGHQYNISTNAVLGKYNTILLGPPEQRQLWMEYRDKTSEWKQFLS